METQVALHFVATRGAQLTNFSSNKSSLFSFDSFAGMFETVG